MLAGSNAFYKAKFFVVREVAILWLDPFFNPQSCGGAERLAEAAAGALIGIKQETASVVFRKGARGADGFTFQAEITMLRDVDVVIELLQNHFARLFGQERQDRIQNRSSRRQDFIAVTCRWSRGRLVQEIADAPGCPMPKRRKEAAPRNLQRPIIEVIGILDECDRRLPFGTI